MISWNWGTDTVLAFDPAADRLDFGWFQPTNFDLSQVEGSTRIAIVGNQQTHPRRGGPGPDEHRQHHRPGSGHLTKWSQAIANAGTTTTDTGSADTGTTDTGSTDTGTTDTGTDTGTTDTGTTDTGTDTGTTDTGTDTGTTDTGTDTGSPNRINRHRINQRRYYR